VKTAKVSLEEALGGSIDRANVSSNYVETFVMLPLTTITADGRDVSSDIYWMFDRLSDSGLDGFMVDVWWGLTEPSPKSYLWDGYRKLFDLAKNRGWKVQVVSSFHQCGGNVGDDCFIPIPSWIPRDQDIWYKDQNGNQNPEYISLFADNVKLQPTSASSFLSSSTCAVPDGSKSECGFYGIDRSGCEAQGCCWSESSTNGVPWCFNSAATPAPTPPSGGSCSVSDSAKRDCGFSGITSTGCVETGCCWAESGVNGVPWCFYSEDGPSPTPTPTPTTAPSPPTGDGRTPVEMYSDWFAAFASEFSSDLGSTIVEVMVGLGPAGELRYPAYPLAHWSFCGVGEFQCFDDHALASLEEAANQRNRFDWRSPFSRSVVGGYNSKPPASTDFFNYVYQGDQGKFFLEWYFGSLKDHGARVLSQASSVFGQYPGVKLAGKIAGIHWWYGDKSNAAEVTAGYYNANGVNAYAEIAETFRNSGDVVFCFTCLEMRNYEQPSECASAPEDLVRQTSSAAAAAGIRYAGENALPRYDRNAYDQIISNKGSMTAFTYLRLNPQLIEGQNYEEFKRFVYLMH